MESEPKSIVFVVVTSSKQTSTAIATSAPFFVFTLDVIFVVCNQSRRSTS